MKVLIQRVARAEVRIDGEVAGAIGTGLLALIGIEPQDDATAGVRAVERMLAYRVFDDGAGKMNRSLRDVGGGLLLVSQFTLAADTRSGLRPGFSTAAVPAHAEALFGALVAAARARWSTVATGRFGANMQVELVNDGPVTFLLDF